MARQTKADRILNDAGMRNAQSALNTAKETLRVLQEAYDALEKELTPKPRTRAATASASQASQAKPANTKAPKADARSNGQLCIAKIPGLDVECGDPEDNRVHDKNAGYAGYHPFEPPAQPAEKKSKKKAAAARATQNSEIEKAAVISAGS